MGFPKEKREFTPHITIGRGKRLPREILRSLKSAINNIPVKSSIAFQVKEVTLVESILSRKGPIYETQETFPLSG
jgi:2'-5' RNA ligase